MPETDNTPKEKVRQLERKLYVCAKQSRTRRFHVLYDRIYRSDVLWEAWRRVRSNGGGRLEAKKGKRLEIRVTAVGQLRTTAKRSPLGPCDEIGSGDFGYGHLGAWPAELVIQHFSDIEVKANPNSPGDYGKMYHGAL